MRCGERQDRWYICENLAEWRMCLVLVWRLSRSVALTSACCLPPFFLDTLWCHVLCVCSQRCRFLCDGLHNILYIGSSQKVIRTVLHVYTVHLLNYYQMLAVLVGPPDGFLEKCSVILGSLFALRSRNVVCLQTYGTYMFPPVLAPLHSSRSLRCRLCTLICNRKTSVFHIFSDLRRRFAGDVTHDCFLAILSRRSSKASLKTHFELLPSLSPPVPPPSPRYLPPRWRQKLHGKASASHRDVFCAFSAALFFFKMGGRQIWRQKICLHFCWHLRRFFCRHF